MSVKSIKTILASAVLLSASGTWAANVDPEMAAFTCFGCHGENGASKGAAPSIKGLPAKYLNQSLNDYRTDRRPGTIMPRIAKGYNEAEIKGLSDYLSKLK